MKNKTLLLSLLILFFASASNAQLNVGSASAPDASAVLQATSSTKGFLPPSMTTTQRNAIVNPATGLLIFNTTTLMVEVNSGSTSVPAWNSTTLYNGDGTLSGARTVAQGTNSLTFNGTGGINLTSGTINVAANALTGTGASIGTIVGLGVRADGGLNIGQNSTNNNIYIGYQAGQANTTGSNNQFMGYKAGQANTTGFYNYFSGYQAGQANTTGFYNNFSGYFSGYFNTTGNTNNFSGFVSGLNNTTGYNNNFSGAYSGFNNTTGDSNNFSGESSGTNNTTGSNNNFSGVFSGLNNTTGSNNNFSGVFSGYSNSTGSNNTALGYNAGPSADGFTNSTAIGNGALVNASNSVRIGNTSVSLIEGQVAYTYPSDARFKYNVQTNVPGIAFIKKLHPVTYQFDTKKMDQFLKTGVLSGGFNEDGKAPIQTGFLAQDVEKAANELGIVFDGVHAPANNRDHYSIAYSQFVMPLVKAMQEQQAQIENLAAQNKQMSLQLAELKDTKIALAEMRIELNKIMAIKVATQNK